MDQSDVFEILKVVGSAIAQTFGENCEVLIHDTSDPARSIIWIEGNVTGRQVGGPMTNVGLSTLQGEGPAEDYVNYAAHAADGRPLKSSTVFLRDKNGEVFGIFCFNIDLSPYTQLHIHLDKFVTPTRNLPIQKSFAPDLNRLLDTLIEKEMEEIQSANGNLTREDRVNMVARLEKKGFFRIRKAVPVLAERLHVSRFTLYNDLKHVRGEE